MVYMIVHRKYSQVKYALACGLLKTDFFFQEDVCTLWSSGLEFNARCFYIPCEFLLLPSSKSLSPAFLSKLAYWLIFLFYEKLKCKMNKTGVVQLL